MCIEACAITMPTHLKSLPTQRRFRSVNNAFQRQPPGESAVFTDIRSVLFILKATGLLPIYEEVNHYEVGPPTKQNEFYSFFVRGVVHALTLFNLYNIFSPGGTKYFITYSETDNVNKWIEILLCILTYAAMVILCAKNSKNFVKIMNEILKVDEDIRRQYGAVLDNNCGFSTKFFVGIVVCQVFVIALTIYELAQPPTTTTYVLVVYYAVQNLLSSTFIVFTAALLKIIRIRFAYLNQVLNGYTYMQQQKIRRHTRRVGEIAAMVAFPDDSLFTFRMHNKLLRIYKLANDCCGLVLVGYMGYAFYTITTTTYNLFIEITMHSADISISTIQWSCVWLMLHTSLLALLSRCCGQATKEANVTSQILARVYGKSKEYQNIIDKFLTKSIKQEVQFTAYGFFVIDNSTLFKIFSAVTTYLVILIQFKQLEDSKMEDKKATQL